MFLYIFSPFCKSLALDPFLQAFEKFALQTEHIPGKQNDVSDLLSRAWHLDDNEFTLFLHEHFSPQIPKNFCIRPLPSYYDMFVNFGVYSQENVKEGRNIIINDMMDRFTNHCVSTIGAAMASGKKSTAPDSSLVVDPNKGTQGGPWVLHMVLNRSLLPRMKPLAASSVVLRLTVSTVILAKTSQVFGEDYEDCHDSVLFQEVPNCVHSILLLNNAKLGMPLPSRL